MILHPDVTNKKSIGVFNTLEQKFSEVHGDKYDYSEVEYKGSLDKVKIICSKHGVFTQTPSDHLSGNGCPKCKNKNKTKTIEQFIEEAREVHGDIYDYSLVEYKNNSTRVKIVCSAHGIFEQSPNSHLRGCGCSSCVGLRKKTTEQFIIDARVVHNDRYDYTLVEYKNNKTKVKIICPAHGVFEQIPNDHLTGCGCYNCGKLVTNRSNTEEFVVKARIKHGDKYDYSMVVYENNITKISIICRLHGVFLQKPADHLRGNGCSNCSKELTHYEKYKDKRTILYYIKIDNFYKIGLTQSSVENRFYKEIKEGINIEIIKTIEFEDGWKAYLLEQTILKETNHLRLKKKESPIKGGWTEVRRKDIYEYINTSIC